MKIKRISLCNVGPYSGTNIFNLDCSNKNKNIVLLGGKNGAGKTTFFTSLRTCLYGYRAYGYENNNQYYFDEIYKLINDNEKIKSSGHARVEMNLLFDDGMDNNEYLIVRDWTVIKNKITEEYHIYLNDKEILDDELIDFENYLLHIIPPNLFKFYFFDGEKIGEFFLQNNQDNSFKNAFLTMTGYDNIELLIKNFKRNVSSITKDSSKSNQYFSLQNELQILEQNLTDKLNEQKENNNLIIEITDKISKLDRDYAKNGGLSIDKWQEINKEILLEENKREDYHRIRKELANTEIPYLILSNKLNQLKNQIEKEDKLLKKQAIKEYVNETSLNKILSEIKTNDNNVKDAIIKIICKYIEDNINIDNNDNILLGLSTQEKNEILFQIKKHDSFDKNVILDLSNSIKESLLKAQSLRTKLEKSNIDKYQEFINEKQECLNNKLKAEIKSKDLEIEIIKLNNNLIEKENLFKKIKKDYEEELKALSVNDISSRALLALTDVSEQLLRTQIDKVENNFKEIFKKLINKEDFIDGIYIDEKLNIYPYKNIRYSKNDIKKLLDSNKNIEEYVGKRGIEIINKELNNENKYIDLPVEISSPFSQGEKQVYIMSIYFALMEISRVEVPFVIDTPFARIDKEHRMNIIKYFFTKLKGQVFILSTDEEINNQYYNEIKEFVSDKYLLKYENRGKTLVLKDDYFIGGENK